MNLRTHFLALFLVLPGLLSAQLDWLVEPTLETPDFHYGLTAQSGWVLVGDRTSGVTIQNARGEVQLDGRSFRQLQYMPQNETWTGLDAEGNRVLFTSDGRFLSEGYDQFNRYYRTNVILVQRDELFGLLDTDGTEICPPRYTDMRRLGRGRYWGRRPNGQMDTLRVKETDGRTAEERASALRINSGQIRDRIMISAPGKKRNHRYWGWTSMDRDTLLAPNRYYSNYNNMLYAQQVMIATDSHNDKVGVLNHEGTVLIPFQYDEIAYSLIDQRYFSAVQDGELVLLGLNGKEVWRGQGESLTSMLHLPYARFSLSEGGVQLWGMDFTPILPDTFQEVWSPVSPNTWFILKKNGRYGTFSHASGHYEVPKYDRIRGPYLAPRIIGQRRDSFWLFDPQTGTCTPDRPFRSLKRIGQLYQATEVRLDSTLQGGVMRPRSKQVFYLLDTLGREVRGAYDYPTTHLHGNVYLERPGGQDSVILHDFDRGIHRTIVGREATFYENVVRLGDSTYYYLDDFFYGKAEREFTFLDTKKGEALKRYGEGGKYGLVRDGVRLTAAVFDEIDPKWSDRGIRVRYRGKWGVLRPFPDKKE
ncbi:WG repeat-containing protein [Lewinella sp. W8]|uniref:WG repeat-containing protein n=1 Tax=Lewinella sp. W8 TaxID=2528208 RepID=UPI001067DEC8|nr:WG repeat-containing protein [Lewinella sp. W8]MTB49625.1 hypothetical protein [Lewinella sp. W8]